MMKKLYQAFFILSIILQVNQVYANNLQISNLTLGSRDTANKTVKVNFKLQWDNSWKVDSSQNNWDAVWVFVKFRNLNQDYWQHASLSYGAGHSAVDANIDGSDDTGTGLSKGVFVYSAENLVGQQSVSYDVSLQWEYGEDHQGDGDTFEVQVYGIEMVYVPQARYYLGSKSGLTGEFFLYNTSDSDKSKAYLVSSENAITVGTEKGNLYYILDDVNVGDLQGGVIPAEFPKGYQAFYCMKYEITQGQYVDYVNTLSSDQAEENTPNRQGYHRNNFTHNGSEYETSTPSLPQNGLGHIQLLNYLDWACLRPMTELEYEKACRGTLAPVNREYVWGTEDINDAEYTLANEGTDAESIDTGYSTTLGNITHYDAVFNLPDVNGNQAVTRVGIYATNTSDRVSAGATYYGILDMSGNVFETVIPVSVAEGRAYTGEHGDGVLDNFGRYDVTGWPSLTAGAGVGQRGGSVSRNKALAQLSYRGYAAKYIANGYGYAGEGGRGVRTAP